MFWSIFAGQFGFGQFWWEKLVLVDFGQKKGFSSILTAKTGFGPKKLVLVDFDRKNWIWSILAGKTGF